MINKKLLFSLSKSDFEFQTFRSGGAGGQHQNTTDSGVRIIHKESGARGECRNHKSQHQNKKEAFTRLTNTPKFKIWVNKKVNELDRGTTIEQEVDKMMSVDGDFMYEFRDDHGKWVIVNQENSDDS